MKTSFVQPYLFFGGRCEEALAFYRNTIGAEVKELMRFKESPEPPPPGEVGPDWQEKIMHVTFRIGESELMGSDGCEKGDGFAGFALSISLADAEEAERTFNALAEGGEITMPLGKTFFAARFGMVTDRFGICWMVTA